jgi:hypothetical protein
MKTLELQGIEAWGIIGGSLIIGSKSVIVCAHICNTLVVVCERVRSIVSYNNVHRLINCDLAVASYSGSTSDDDFKSV